MKGTGDGRIKYPFLKLALAPLIGGLIAFQGLPDSQKAMFGPMSPPIVAIVLGALYALEKLVVKSPGENSPPPDSGSGS
jgi:hypothetical protein